jgi:hypothetical protein
VTEDKETTNSFETFDDEYYSEDWIYEFFLIKKKL